MDSESLRALPSVDRVIREIGLTQLPRASLIAIIRRELESVRVGSISLTSDQVFARIREAIDDLLLARIRPVINGTGVILHTNLGRSPLGEQVVQSITDIAANYNNLELDLAGGERGSRAAYLEHNLAVLCGAQAATVVNNCAAALVLILRHFTSGSCKQVIISRGELIQIGGGFRIPEILEASGATIRDVGTTNKTSLSDYQRAISDETAMILKVHRSNFHMEGFVESPETGELSALARENNVPFVEDLGSGATFHTEALAEVEHEPMPAKILARGVDLVCFSGDKLFGGPQAGIIAGDAKMVGALKAEPFFRALRCDKLILAAMQTTVDLHLRATEQPSEPAEDVPILAMLRQAPNSLMTRAQSLVDALADLPAKFEVGSGESKMGGGTLPKASIPSITLDVLPQAIKLNDLAATLRRGSPPVIGTISGNRFKIDLRTVFPRQDADLANALRAAFTPAAQPR